MTTVKLFYFIYKHCILSLAEIRANNLLTLRCKSSIAQYSKCWKSQENKFWLSEPSYRSRRAPPLVLVYCPFKKPPHCAEAPLVTWCSSCDNRKEKRLWLPDDLWVAAEALFSHRRTNFDEGNGAKLAVSGPTLIFPALTEDTRWAFSVTWGKVGAWRGTKFHFLVQHILVVCSAAARQLAPHSFEATTVKLLLHYYFSFRLKRSRSNREGELRTRYSSGWDGGQQTSSSGRTSRLQRRPGGAWVRPAPARVRGHPAYGPAALPVPRRPRQVAPFPTRPERYTES